MQPGIYDLPPLANASQQAAASTKRNRQNSFYMLVLVFFLSAFVITLLYFNRRKPAGTATLSNPSKNAKEKDAYRCRQRQLEMWRKTAWLKESR
jgi:hypothetical protein